MWKSLCLTIMLANSNACLLLIVLPLIGCTTSSLDPCPIAPPHNLPCGFALPFGSLYIYLLLEHVIHRGKALSEKWPSTALNSLGHLMLNPSWNPHIPPKGYPSMEPFSVDHFFLPSSPNTLNCPLHFPSFKPFLLPSVLFPLDPTYS